MRLMLMDKAKIALSHFGAIQTTSATVIWRFLSKFFSPSKFLVSLCPEKNLDPLTLVIGADDGIDQMLAAIFLKFLSF